MGYRDTSISFRDQTRDILDAQSGGMFDQVEPSTMTGVVNMSGDGDRGLDFSFSPIQTPPSVSVQERAVPAFIHDYVLDDAELPNSFHFLPEILRREPAASGLMHAVRAVGIASIALGGKWPNAMVAGDAEYTSALRAVNASLADPERAKDDRTLITVMMLGMYEVRPNALISTLGTENLRIVLGEVPIRWSLGQST